MDISVTPFVNGSTGEGVFISFDEAPVEAVKYFFALKSILKEYKPNVVRSSYFLITWNGNSVRS